MTQNKQRTKRILAWVLAIAMVLTLQPVMSVPALAATAASTTAKIAFVTGTPQELTGSGGGTANWNGNGTLTLSDFVHSSTAQVMIGLPDESTIVFSGTNVITQTGTATGGNIDMIEVTGSLEIESSGNGASLTLLGQGETNTGTSNGAYRGINTTNNGDIKITLNNDAEFTVDLYEIEQDIQNTQQYNIALRLDGTGDLTIAGDGTGIVTLRTRNLEIAADSNLCDPVQASDLTLSATGVKALGGDVTTDEYALTFDATNKRFAFETSTDGSRISFIKIWKPMYTVTYNANAGAEDITVPATVKYEPNSTVTVDFTIGTREGYDFEGWATTSSVATPTYTVTGTNSFSITGNTTLYAIWSSDTALTATGTLTFNGSAFTATSNGNLNDFKADSMGELNGSTKTWYIEGSTLYLYNFVYSTDSMGALTTSSSTAKTIVLMGDNSFTSAYVGASTTRGLYMSSGNLTIRGNGTLTLQAGTYNGTYADSYSAGIYKDSSGTFTINERAKVIAKGGISTMGSYGVYAGDSGTVTVAQSATLIAQAGAGTTELGALRLSAAFSSTPNTPMGYASEGDELKALGFNGNLYKVSDGSATAIYAIIAPEALGDKGTLKFTGSDLTDSNGNSITTEKAITADCTDGTWFISGGTLYLKGFHYETIAGTALLVTGNGTIMLANGSTNSITSGNINNFDSVGINAEGDLTIEGSGTLNATGGVPNDGSSNSYGICVKNGDLSISNATVTAIGGNANNGTASFGIDVDGDVTINNSTVTATADAGYYGSEGLRTNGKLTLTDSTLIATGNAAAESHGLMVDDLALPGSTIKVQTTASGEGSADVSAIKVCSDPNQYPRPTVSAIGGEDSSDNHTLVWDDYDYYGLVYNSDTYAKYAVITPAGGGTTPTDIVINIAAIQGVTTPVGGATPVTTITETDQYTGTVTWSPTVSGTFAYDQAYTATITLTPKTGYTLTGVGENSFTVASATATNSADSGVITAVFPATGSDSYKWDFTQNTSTAGNIDTDGYTWDGTNGTIANMQMKNLDITITDKDFGMKFPNNKAIIIELMDETTNSITVNNNGTDVRGLTGGSYLFVKGSGTLNITVNGNGSTNVYGVYVSGAASGNKIDGVTVNVTATGGSTINTAYKINGNTQLTLQDNAVLNVDGSNAANGIGFDNGSTTTLSLAKATAGLTAKGGGRAIVTTTIGAIPNGFNAIASTSYNGSSPTTTAFTELVANVSYRWQGNDATLKNISLTASTAPTITTSSLPSGTVGTAYSQTISATGTTPITWSIDSGSLPTGLTLTGNTISGTPTTAGTQTFTVKATNSAGNDTKSLSITIGGAGGKSIPTTSDLNYTLTDVAYSKTPQGVTITPKTGVGEVTVKYNGSITKPTNAGTYTITADIAEGTNYSAATGIVIGAWTITKRPITITADTKTKSIGTAEPTLTYNITSGSLLSGDTLTGGLTRRTGETVGVYAIISTLTNPNYAITYEGSNLTITSPTVQTPQAPTGGISGTVTDNSGSGDITVRIELGNKIAASIIIDNAANPKTFSFTELIDGYYNIVVDNGIYKTTRIVEVKDGQSTSGIEMELGQKQSVVEVKPADSGSSTATPDVVVGGLDELFPSNNTTNETFTQDDKDVVAAGGTVEIKLIATGKSEGNVTSDANKIKKIASGKTLSFMDFTVEKTQLNQDGDKIKNDTIPVLSDIITIVFPIPSYAKNTNGIKPGFAIYRVHEGSEEIIPKGETNKNSDEEYFEIINDNIILKVKKFSTYAIGYTDDTTGGNQGGNSGGSIITTNAQNPTISVQPKDAAIKVDETHTLTVESTVIDGGTVSYQWYVNTSAKNSGGTAIVGATKESYTVSTTKAGTYYYYVVVTNTNNSINGSKTATTASNAITITVTEKDTETKQFTVTYKKNGGGTVSGILSDKAKYVSGSKVTVIGIPVSTSKFFAGWNTKADGTGKSYTDGKTFKITEDITLYAQWRDTVTGSAKITYKVTGKNEVACIGTTAKKATTITIADTFSYKGITYKVTSIAKNAFRGNEKVTTVIIGNNVKTIHNTAFFKCFNLKKVTIGTGLVTLNNHVFCHAKEGIVVTINSTKLKTVKTATNHGIKNMVIKVPKSKLAAYKKLFAQTSKTVKVEVKAD